MRASIVTCIPIVACTLGACRQPLAPQQAPAPPAVSAATGSAPAPTDPSPSAGAPADVPRQPAAAGSAAFLPDDHASTRNYRISIDLPALRADEAPLAKALRATADDAKREFLASIPDPIRLPEFADRQLTLSLDFEVVARTPRFTSVRETGSADTGGAHPIPVAATFVLDRKLGRLIALDDLFAAPDAARAVLAAFARTALEKKLMADAPKPGEGSPAAIREWKANMQSMLDDGTRPTAANYATFAIRAGADAAAPSPGLTLVFAPYQVAPYVYGTQTVEVPARVFDRLLQPAYSGDFAAR